MPQVFVKTLRGKTIVVDFDPKDTVFDLKQRILSREGITHDINCFQLYRLYQHKRFNNDYTLDDCGIAHEHNIRLGYRQSHNSPPNNKN